MPGMHEQKRIDDMRRRLYSRGDQPAERTNVALTDEPVSSVQTAFAHPPTPKSLETPVEPEETEPVMVTSRRKKYRIKVLLAGVIFFVAALLISSSFLFFGGNTISGENITISLSGPFTIGGGETMALQVGVTNANAVPIQSATLLIQYPNGTKSVDDDPRDLFIERVPLDAVASGETINVPLRAIVFGEENEEQTIEASIEYRVSGSNATFFKEAEPLRYKISSAPIVARVAANQKISSGQETDIVLTLSSNTQTPIQDILVEADYPLGFDFTSASPDTVSGKNLWLIESLDPGEETTITIRGIIVGKETDELAMHFSVGVPQERDPNVLASIFSTASTQFEIESPFIDVTLDIDGAEDGIAIVSSDQAVSGLIDVTNTLSDTIYDTTVTVVLAGNAVRDEDVSQTSGFYDSSNNTITWDPNSFDRLRELRPGESVRLNFSVTPDTSVTRTPQIGIDVDVSSRRVSEDRVPEELRGSAEGMIRVASVPTMLSEARRINGPVPPEAEQSTTYTMSILIENGSNNIDKAEVTTQLPSYVTWKDSTAGVGTITYNPSTRTVTWQAGDVAAAGTVVGSFDVALKPSKSQIGTTPTLMAEQRLSAPDSFTGGVVRSSKAAVTSELSTELGFESGNGRVIE